MSPTIYLIGYGVILLALALGAYYLRVPTRWIVVGVIFMVGIALTRLARSPPKA